MKYKKTPFPLIMTTFVIALCISCNGSNTPAAPTGNVENDSYEAPADETGIDIVTPLDGDDGAAPIFERDSSDYNAAVAEPEAKPAQQQKQKVDKPSYGGKETLYISTYGANGKVWGHVTMNGKTGRGTIHDDDENSYSITVTRHGGELYGTDQNGRQYVFRL